jgi:uncharacterized lipoprotein YajG
MLRKLVPLVALVLAAACSADSVTGPSAATATQQAPPQQARLGSGMMGGGG